MQTSEMIFNDLKDIADKNISPTNAMLFIKGIKAARERKHRAAGNVNKEQRNLCEKSGLSPLLYLKHKQTFRYMASYPAFPKGFVLHIAESLYAEILFHFVSHPYLS